MSITSSLETGWQGHVAQPVCPDVTDRRASRRYPMTMHAKYGVLDRARVAVLGVGRTVDLSARGVLLESAHELPIGAVVELSVAWPARLDDVVPLNLWLQGLVVRSRGNRAAISVVRYEFRTRGSLPQRIADGEVWPNSAGCAFDC